MTAARAALGEAEAEVVPAAPLSEPVSGDEAAAALDAAIADGAWVGLRARRRPRRGRALWHGPHPLGGDGREDLPL